MATFLVFRSTTNNQYYFNLRDQNDRLLLQSEGYTSHAGCLNGVSAVRQNAPANDNYRRLNANDSSYYFTLVSKSNGEVLGVSPMYPFSFQREDAIAKTMAQAPGATLQDSTSASSRY